MAEGEGDNYTCKRMMISKQKLVSISAKAAGPSTAYGWETESPSRSTELTPLETVSMRRLQILCIIIVITRQPIRSSRGDSRDPTTTAIDECYSSTAEV